MHFVSSKVIAACFGLSALAVAIIAGMAAGNGIGEVLMRAMFAAIVCYPVGVVVGMICAHVISEQIARAEPESSARKSSATAASSPGGIPKHAQSDDEQPIVV
jgi:hypothetical protein